MMSIVNGQPSVQIETGNASILVATANDLELRSFEGSTVASIRSVLSSLSDVNSTAVQAYSKANQANQLATMNDAAIGLLSQQIAARLNFSGEAASEASLMTQISSMAVRMSRAEAALNRLETHSLATCTQLCTGGTCRNTTTGTGSLFTCHCNPGYFGNFCQQTNAPTSAPTARPTEAPTELIIDTCAQAPQTGTYRMRPGFTAYCIVTGSSEPNWMRVLHWPGSAYRINTAAVNAAQCALPNPNGHCKLSDAHINSVIPTGSRGRYYWANTSALSSSLYIWTTSAYRDDALQFGINTRTCRAAVRRSWVDRFPGTSFRNNYIDFLSPSDNSYNQRESCTRFFMGINTVDCWPGRTGTRCIHGGSTCNLGRYAFIPNWELYIAAA